MFNGCSSLTNIDLFNFNTINVSIMGDMFNGCSSLRKKNIKVKDKKTSNQIFDWKKEINN